MKVDLENIKELKPVKYIDYKIRNVTKIKKKYGFRIVLIQEDATEKTVQHAGFDRKDEAEKERCKVIGQLETKTYIVYNNITVEEYMKHWFKFDAPKRIKSYNSFMSYRNGVFNHIIPRIGKVLLTRLTNGIIKKLYEDVCEYSRNVAEIVQTIMVSALEDGKVNKFVSTLAKVTPETDTLPPEITKIFLLAFNASIVVLLPTIVKSELTDKLFSS